MAQEGTKALPPYGPWPSFTGFVSRIKENAVPSRIDRSLMTGMSGAGQNQLRGALRFFGLMENDGAVTDSFKQLVDAFGTDSWAAAVGRLCDQYAPVINAADAANATPHHLSERFRQGYGIEGDTAKKAVRFYVMALKDAGRSISPFIKLKERRGGTQRKRRAAPAVATANGAGTPAGTDAPQGPPKEVRTGMLTVDVPIPGKPTAHIMLPQNLDSDEWEMIDMYVRKYISLRTKTRTRPQKAADGVK